MKTTLIYQKKPIKQTKYSVKFDISEPSQAKSKKKIEKNSEKFRSWNSNYLVIKKFPKPQYSS